MPAGRALGGSAAAELPRSRATRPVWRELDLSALEANFLECRRLAGPGRKLIASVKANAYGHGAVWVARRLAALGVDLLATGAFDDAVAIRAAGVETPILMFGGNLPEAADAYLRQRLMPTVCNVESAEAAARAAAPGRAPIYVKVDCGLGRLGVPIEDAADFIRRLVDLPGLAIAGLYTHLPFFDAAGQRWAEPRLKAFDQLVRALATDGIEIPVTQAMASTCLLAGLTDHCTAVCPGHLLYGLSPLAPGVADMAGFRPVLAAIKSRLIHVGRHGADRAVGVGGRRVLADGSVTGVAPVGLYDGYRNAAPGQTAMMLVGGKRVPVLGVSLEHATLDLTGVDQPEVGDEVVVVGESGGQSITLEDLAGWQGTRPLDVLMGSDRRVPDRQSGDP